MPESAYTPEHAERSVRELIESLGPGAIEPLPERPAVTESPLVVAMKLTAHLLERTEMRGPDREQLNKLFRELAGKAAQPSQYLPPAFMVPGTPKVRAEELAAIAVDALLTVSTGSERERVGTSLVVMQRDERSTGGVRNLGGRDRVYAIDCVADALKEAL